jgi:hypothetical protein
MVDTSDPPKAATVMLQDRESQAMRWWSHRGRKKEREKRK